MGTTTMFEDAILIQRPALPMKCPRGNVGSDAAIGVQRKVRNATCRVRRVAIGVTCGRGGLGSTAMSWSSRGWRVADGFLRNNESIVSGQRAIPPASQNRRDIRRPKDFRFQGNVQLQARPRPGSYHDTIPRNRVKFALFVAVRSFDFPALQVNKADRCAITAPCASDQTRDF
jgi:hypothetical protein